MNKNFVSNISLTRWEHWVATGFGSGLVPKAPGTVGSFSGLGVWALLLSPLNVWLESILIILVFALGIYVGRESEKDWYRDHPSIVIDEWVGLWIALLPLNWISVSQWLWVVCAFVLFRFFDILKPGLIRKAEKFKTPGVGVMMDDVLAGLVSAVLLLGLIKVVL